MKAISKYFMIFTLLFSIGCKSDGAKVNIKVDTAECSAPLLANFDLSSSEAVSLSKLHSYKVSIIEEGKDAEEALETFTLNPEIMQFDYLFGKIGKYEVIVTIVDTYGGVGKGSVDINVTSPFVGKTWSPSLTSIYANEFLELSASKIGLKDVEYVWEIKQDGQTWLVDKGVNFLAKEKLDSGIYNVELRVSDAYGNSYKFEPKQIEVLSLENPKGLFFAKYEDEEITTSEKIYEYETIVLDASASLASISNLPGVEIKNLDWVVVRNGEVVDKFSKSSKNAFSYELGEAGVYDFAFQISNSIGLKTSSNKVILDIRKNIASLYNINVGQFFEGNPGTVVFKLQQSSSSVKGDIISLALHIEGFDPIYLGDAWKEEWEEEDVLSIEWTPPYDGLTFLNKIYMAYFSVLNEAGREFISEDFSIEVEDNNPRPKINSSREAIMFNNKIDFTASGSFSPDGQAFDYLTFEIYQDGAAVPGTYFNFLPNPDATFSPNVFQGIEAIGVYFAVLTARVGDREQIIQKRIRVTPRETTASFTIAPDPDEEIVFEGNTIILDASGSYDSEGNAIDNNNFAWEIRQNGIVLAKTLTRIGNALFRYEFKENEFANFSFKLTVTGANGTTDSLIKDFYVVENKPKNISVSRQASDIGTQILLGQAVFPDGISQGAVYNWYLNDEPGLGVYPLKANMNPALFNFIDGKNYTLYLEVVNHYGFKSFAEYILEADDLTPPDIPIVVNDYPNSVTSETRPSWRWYASNPDDAAVEWRYAIALAGTGEPANPESWDTTSFGTTQAPVALAEGSYTIYVQARDGADPPNWSASGTNTLEVDLTPPVAPIMNVNRDAYNIIGRTKNRQLTWSWEPGFAPDTEGYRYQLNGTSANGWTEVDKTTKSFTSLANLPDGDYELFVQARDRADNWSAIASSVWTIDNVAPVLTVLGDNPAYIEVFATYADSGALAFDASMVQDLTASIIVSGLSAVDTSVKDKKYTITYAVSDDLGNESQASRSVFTQDTIAPVINLIAGDDVYMIQDATYSEPGYTATDNYDGDITSSVNIVNNIDSSEFGTYKVEYSVKDSSGNLATATRFVTVVSKTINITSAIEMNMITDSDPVEITWEGVTGLSAYTVHRASNFAGPYSQLAIVADLEFSENPGFGVFFYKITGNLVASLGKPESAIVKVARVPASAVPNFVATGASYSYSQIRLSWSKITGVDGYKLFHNDHDLSDSTTGMDAQIVDDFSLASNIANISQSSSAQYIHGSSGNPVKAYKNYYWLQAYVDKDAHGWIGGGLLHSNPGNSVFGLRNLTNEEWVREVNLSVWHALKVITPIPRPASNTSNDNGWSDRQEVPGGGHITGYNNEWSNNYSRGYVLEEARPRYLAITGVIGDLYRQRKNAFSSWYDRNVRVSFNDIYGTSEFLTIAGAYSGEFRYHMHLNDGKRDDDGGPPIWLGTASNGVCVKSRCTSMDQYDYLTARRTKFPTDATHIDFPYQIKRDGASNPTNIVNTAAMWSFYPDVQ